MGHLTFRSAGWSIAAGVVATMVGLIVWAGHKSQAELEADAQPVRLYDRLQPGTTPADVARWLREPGFEKLHIGGSLADLSILTPMRWDARNWVICADVKDGFIAEARIGTLDWCGSTVSGAPPAKTLRTSGSAGQGH